MAKRLRDFRGSVCKEQQSICPVMTAVCRRVCEQQEVDGTVQKGHTRLKDSVCGEEAGAVVEKKKKKEHELSICHQGRN